MLGRSIVREAVTVKLLLNKNIYVTSHCISQSCSRRGEYGVAKEVSTVVSPENAKLLRVAVIGLPNAGKSTFINHFINFEVCPTSRKPHTTRAMQRAIFLEDNIQVVFVDTPGIVNKKESKKFSLTAEFVGAPEASMREVDLVAVIHDVTNKISRHKLDARVIAVLRKFPTKHAILMLNKIDTIKNKRSLLSSVYYLTEGVVNGNPIPIGKTKVLQPKKLNQDDIFLKTKKVMERQNKRMTEELPLEVTEQPECIETPELCEERHNRLDENGRIVRGWPHFRDIFLISALQRDGIDEVKDYFKAFAQRSEWAFNEDMLTDCPPAALCLRIVKAKMLEHMQHEIPYTVTPVLDYWDTNPSGLLRIVVGMEASNERIQKIMVGMGGNLINVISSESEKTLSHLLQIPVDLHIHVTLKLKENKTKFVPKRR